MVLSSNSWTVRLGDRSALECSCPRVDINLVPAELEVERMIEPSVIRGSIAVVQSMTPRRFVESTEGPSRTPALLMRIDRWGEVGGRRERTMDTAAVMEVWEVTSSSQTCTRGWREEGRRARAAMSEANRESG